MNGQCKGSGRDPERRQRCKTTRGKRVIHEVSRRATKGLQKNQERSAKGWKGPPSETDLLQWHAQPFNGQLTSMHRIHRIFSGNGWLAIPGIRKSARDHRPSRLLVQEALVLFILCILCIHVYKKRYRSPEAYPPAHPRSRYHQPVLAPPPSTKKGSQGVGPDCLGSFENAWDLEADASA